jgi:hypothetical protein
LERLRQVLQEEIQALGLEKKLHPRGGSLHLHRGQGFTEGLILPPPGPAPTPAAEVGSSRNLWAGLAGGEPGSLHLRGLEQLGHPVQAVLLRNWGKPGPRLIFSGMAPPGEGLAPELRRELGGWGLRLPALSERREELVQLAEGFLEPGQRLTGQGARALLKRGPSLAITQGFSGLLVTELLEEGREGAEVAQRLGFGQQVEDGNHWKTMGREGDRLEKLCNFLGEAPPPGLEKLRRKRRKK